jgi:tRNA pseudouridine55 synthase
MDGFLLIDKPAGWTSHDVVARVRRLAGQKRVGHTGTLDPDATGVLVVCLGTATRLSEYASGYTKRYCASLALGIETDTQDASGRVVRSEDASRVSAADLEAVLPRFRGTTKQVPPMVSAVHHQGERLHDIARRGGVVEREARAVTVTSLIASDFEPGTVARATLDVECSTGTYVRTLCDDIGASLGVGGHMASLRRLSIGPFDVADAHHLDGLAAASEAGTFAELVRPPVRLLPPEWPRLLLDPLQLENARNGRAVEAAANGDLAAGVHDGCLVAILAREGDTWLPRKVFPGA